MSVHRFPRLARLIVSTLILACVVVGPLMVIAAAAPQPLFVQTAPPLADITPERLAAVAGLILSIAFTYVPKLNARFAALDPDYQRFVMGLLLVAVAAGSLFYTCAFGAVCLQANWETYGLALIYALTANQSANELLPKPTAVKEAKALRLLATQSPAGRPR